MKVWPSRRSVDDDLQRGIDEITSTHGKPGRPPVLRNILVGASGTTASDVAIDVAAHIAARLKANLHLACVGAPDAGRRAAQNDASLAFESGVVRPAEVLRRAAARCVKMGVQPVLHEATGVAAVELVDTCSRLAIDLLVLGMGEEGRLPFTGAGSVTHQAKAAATCSVLVARAPLGNGPILCCVDGSPPSRIAARLALNLAKVFGTDLVVLSVRPQGPLRVPKPSKTRPWNHEPAVTFEVASGPVAPTILEQANLRRPRLVVVGGRGLTRAGGWSLGGVSNQLSAHSEANVLIVKVE